jgi:aconitase B
MNAVAERKTEVVAALPSDAGALMKLIERVAMDPQFDVAKLKELFTLRERWEADEARKAFNVAFTAFKAEAIEIIKNRRSRTAAQEQALRRALLASSTRSRRRYRGTACPHRGGSPRTRPSGSR